MRELNMLATSRNKVETFPLVVQPLVIKAQRENICLLLPLQNESVAKWFRNHYDTRFLCMTERQRLQEIREMQMRYPVGTELQYLGYKHWVLAVVPKLRKKMCVGGVPPPPDKRYELHLRSDKGYYRVVTIADFEKV